MVNILIRDPEQTAKLAEDIAALAEVGETILLHGEMGVGKTYFAKKFLRALGVDEDMVSSPTFTLVNIHETRKGPVWHADLYRIQTPDEVIELGLNEGLAQALSVVEWPERASIAWPDSRLEISLAFHGDGNARHAALNAHGSWQKKIRLIVDAYL
jgi:tRNA threonylcarbamoyladenosine biosynthesis protein TsaE